MATNFDKFAQEANEYINELSADLGHPQERDRVAILLKAVLHTIRDSITISESFHVMSQLPTFLKGVYVEHWKYTDKPRRYASLEEFKEAIKQEQALHGETQFDWKTSTEKLVSQILTSLGTRYLSEGQLSHIADQLPAPVKPLIPVDTE